MGKKTFEENDAGFMYVLDKKNYTIPDYECVDYAEKTFSQKK